MEDFKRVIVLVMVGDTSEEFQDGKEKKYKLQMEDSTADTGEMEIMSVNLIPEKIHISIKTFISINSTTLFVNPSQKRRK